MGQGESFAQQLAGERLGVDGEGQVNPDMPVVHRHRVPIRPRLLFSHGHPSFVNPVSHLVVCPCRGTGRPFGEYISEMIYDRGWVPLRHLIVGLIAVAMLLTRAGTARADAPGSEPVLPATAYLLMDAASGQVLYEFHGEVALPNASTTKIMTAILALELGNLDDVVTAGQKPYETGGSTIYLEVGEQQSLHDLLLALILESANDAAVAIAEHLGGTEERFVAWMNAKAVAIGATQTHFANSHGLHDPNHYTTARDLALIARYAMQNQAFRDLVVTEEATIPGYKDHPPRKLWSHNQLLGYYDGANGVKNGFTEEAGLTNVASARRGGIELIAVVLGAESRVWTSSMALLDFGFSHYEALRIVQRSEAGMDLATPAVPPDAAEPPLPVAPAPSPKLARPFAPELLLVLGGIALAATARRRRRLAA
jgi:serine-type D-Ala-D-Ala carboxypeptidase (penicillin-binding protein 5/6)